jgi:hypothetical protein
VLKQYGTVAVNKKTLFFLSISNCNPPLPPIVSYLLQNDFLAVGKLYGTILVNKINAVSNCH